MHISCFVCVSRLHGDPSTGIPVMYCLLEVVSVCPEKLAPLFVEKIDWIKVSGCLARLSTAAGVPVGGFMGGGAIAFYSIDYNLHDRPKVKDLLNVGLAHTMFREVLFLAQSFCSFTLELSTFPHLFCPFVLGAFLDHF